MCEIVKYACDELGGAEVRCVLANDVLWFKAVDVAKVLAYSNSRRAIKDHVDDEDKRTCGDIVATVRGNETLRRTVGDDSALYINESGMYSLIFSKQ